MTVAAVAAPRGEAPGAAAPRLGFREAARIAAAPFVAGKALSLLVPFLYAWIDSGGTGVVPGGSTLSGYWNQWDTQSYVHIAEHGYPATTAGDAIHYDAFLPGYPLLMRLVAFVLRDALAAGIVVSAVAEAVLLVYVVRLVAAERDVPAARFAAWVLAAWPYSFFLTAAYTESLFLALAAIALYEARHGSMAWAWVAAALSVAVRITGLVLIVPLAIEVLRRAGVGWRDAARPLRALRAVVPPLLGAVLVPLPFAAFMLYMRAHTGDALAFFHAQSSPSFNHSFDTPWNGFNRTLHTVSADSPLYANFVFIRELVFGIAGLVACGLCWAWRRFPLAWAAYCTAVWLSATSLTFWLSVPRYELAMFPALLILADITRRRPGVRQAIVTVSAGLLGMAAVVFVRQQWLG